MFHNAIESTADANTHSSVAILTFIMCLTATEGKRIVTVCSALPFHCMTGHHYSVDWTAGLDYWTGLLDSRKLPLEETEGTAYYAQTPSHMICSSIVVTHLNV